MNARRLEASCDRLCVPRIDPEMFLAGIERLVDVDQAWIPARRGESLYIRPIIFSNESHLEVRPSRAFRMLVMASPVRSYFDESMPAVTLKVEDTYTRAAPGGTGAAKTAGNYAGSLYPAELARREGYMQVLWLDGVEQSLRGRSRRDETSSSASTAISSPPSCAAPSSPGSPAMP